MESEDYKIMLEAHIKKFVDIKSKYSITHKEFDIIKNFTDEQLSRYLEFRDRCNVCPIDIEATNKKNIDDLETYLINKLVDRYKQDLETLINYIRG